MLRPMYSKSSQFGVIVRTGLVITVVVVSDLVDMSGSAVAVAELV